MAKPNTKQKSKKRDKPVENENRKCSSCCKMLTPTEHKTHFPACEKQKRKEEKAIELQKERVKEEHQELVRAGKATGSRSG